MQQIINHIQVEITVTHVNSIYKKIMIYLVNYDCKALVLVDNRLFLNGEKTNQLLLIYLS